MKSRNGNGNGNDLDVHTNGLGDGHYQPNGHGHDHGHGHGHSGLQDHRNGVHRNGPSLHQPYSPYPSYQPFDSSMRASSSSSSSIPPPPPPGPPMHSTHQPPPPSRSVPPSLMFTTASGPSPTAMPDYPTPSGSGGLPTAPTPGRHHSSFAFSPSAFKAPGEFSWLDNIFDNNSTIFGGNTDFLGDSSSLFTTQFPSEQAHLLSLESPEHLLATGSGGSAGIGGSGSMLPPLRREPQLEDVTSWANISHYISLFLQYLYPLLPLVHRPTFAEHLATRRDLRDTDFRALLLSIGRSTCLIMTTTQG